MRLLTWNVNHRMLRRRIPQWVASSIAEQQPSLVVLTEYVEGPDHTRFLDQLSESGLRHHKTSAPNETGNQVLIASAAPLRSGHVKATLEPYVRENTLHVKVPDLGLNVVGFRLPAFK